MLKYWWITLLSLFLIGGAIFLTGVVVVYIIPRTYEATVAVDLPRDVASRPIRDLQIYDHVIDDLDLKDSLEVSSTREIYDYLDEAITSNFVESRGTEITVTSMDPEFSAVLANSYGGALSRLKGATILFEAATDYVPDSPDVAKLLARTTLLAMIVSLAIGLLVSRVVANKKAAKDG